MSKKSILKTRSRRKTGIVKGEEALPTLKMRMFVAEYLADFNGARAAIAVGVSESSARVKSSRWLKDPRVVDIVNEYRREHVADIQILKDEWLKQLFFLCTRSAAEFVNPKTGEMLSLHKLGERAAACVDGFDVEVRESENGSSVKTKVRLVPKAQALRMAAEHLGLIVPSEQNVNVGIDWKSLAALMQGSNDPTVEEQLKMLEQQVLDAKSEPAD